MCSSAQGKKKKLFWKLPDLMGFVDFSKWSESVCLKGTGSSHKTEARITIKNKRNSHQDGSKASENVSGAETSHLRDILDIGAAVIPQRAPG